MQRLIQEFEGKRVEWLRRKYEETDMNYDDILYILTYLQLRDDFCTSDIVMYGKFDFNYDEDEFMKDCTKEELKEYMKKRMDKKNIKKIYENLPEKPFVHNEEDIYYDSDEDGDFNVWSNKVQTKNQLNPLYMAYIGLFDVLQMSYMKEKNELFLTLQKEWSHYFMKKMLEEHFPGYFMIKNLGFSEDIQRRIFKYVDQPMLFKKISKSPHIYMETVLQYPELNWDFNELTKHPNITLVDIKENPNFPWKMRQISKNPNITEENIDMNPQIKWNYQDLSFNLNISKEYLIKTEDDKKRWDIQIFENRVMYRGMKMVYEDVPFRLRHIMMKFDFIRERIRKL